MTNAVSAAGADDGKGIDLKLLNDDERPGHYGMRGMRERAKLLAVS